MLVNFCNVKQFAWQFGRLNLERGDCRSADSLTHPTFLRGWRIQSLWAFRRSDPEGGRVGGWVGLCFFGCLCPAKVVAVGEFPPMRLIL